MNNKYVLSSNLDYEDLKVALIANYEVVEVDKFASLFMDYCVLLAICCKAQEGNIKASEYLNKGVIDRFNDYIADSCKGTVLASADQFLGTKNNP